MASHTTSLDGDVRAVLDDLRRIVQCLRTSSRDTQRRFNLSAAQLFALQQVAALPGSSIKDLAARTFTHQSSVSVVVQRLVKRKLVAKIAAKDDRRRVRLAITDDGRRVLRRSPQPAQERLIAGIASLKAADRRVLVEALTTMARTLTPTTAPPPMLFEEGRDGATWPAARPRRGRRATAKRPGASR
jgi:DNA-binding MarR family transcriptional regulator